MRALVLAACLVGPAGHAAVIAVAKAPDGSAVLVTDEDGPCVGGAKLAIWSSPDGRERVPGCWRAGAGGLFVSFLDGDRADIPLQTLSKPTGL